MAYDGALKFDTKVDQSGFVGGISQLKSTAMAAIGAIGGAFATGAIAKALIGQIGLVEQYGSAINDQSQKIGITTQAYQELNYIMGQVGGNVDMLQMGIKTLSSAVVDGNKAFEQLGISLDEARAMSQEDLFNTVIAQLAGMESGTLRTSLATDLFGRSASELAPLLNMGADGIAKMRKEAQTYGLVMTNEAVAATDRFGDAQALAQKSGEALRNAMIGKMMPALTNIALGFADIAKASTEAFNARGIAGVVDVITGKFPIATAAVAGLTAAFTSLLIIKGITAVMVAFQTAQVSLALGMMGTTAAALVQAGALTANEVIVGLLTGKITLAAAAQALWNTVMLANPIGLLITAIGLLVGGVVLLTKAYEKANPEIYEARENIEAVSKSMEESAKTYTETTREIETQQNALNGLIDTLVKMSNEYSGSSIEQAKMQSICNELNGSIDGLSVSFDTNTGKLNSNAQAMKDVVAAQYDAATASAALARYQELVTEKFNADYAVRQAKKSTTGKSMGALDAFTPWNAAASESARNLEIAEEKAASASSALSEFDEILLELGVDISDVTGSTADALETVEEEVDRVIVGGYDVTDVLDDIGMTADEVAARLDNFTGAATNMFEKISTESKIKVADMISNLEANAIAIEDWGDNIAYLGGKLPSDLLQPLIDQGPADMAGVLNELAGASDAELANLAAAFGNGGEEAKEAWLLSLGVGLEEENPLLGVLDGATEAASESGTAFSQALVASINGQNYSGATSSLTSAFVSSFNSIKTSFSSLLQRIHYDLAYAIGGVRGDIQDMAAGIRSALNQIPTNITIHVNVVYSSSGGTGGVGSTTGVAGTKPLIGSGGVYAPITIQGVVESDAQLSNRITREFNGVMYGRNS